MKTNGIKSKIIVTFNSKMQENNKNCNYKTYANLRKNHNRAFLSLKNGMFPFTFFIFFFEIFRFKNY